MERLTALSTGLKILTMMQNNEKKYIHLNQFSKITGIDYNKVRKAANGSGCEILTPDNKLVKVSNDIDHLLEKLEVTLEGVSYDDAFVEGVEVDELRSAEKKIETLSKQFETIVEEKETVLKQFQNLSEKHETVLKQFEKVSKKNETLSEFASPLTEKIELLSQQNETLSRKLQIVSEEKETLSSQLKSVENYFETAEIEKKQILEQLETAQIKEREARRELASQTKDEFSLLKLATWICMIIMVISMIKLFGWTDFYSFGFGLAFSFLFVVISLATMRLMEGKKEGKKTGSLVLYCLYAVSGLFIHQASISTSLQSEVVGDITIFSWWAAALLALTEVFVMFLQKNSYK